MKVETETFTAKKAQIESAILHLKDPQVVGREARDRFDLADKEDLVFIFSDSH